MKDFKARAQVLGWIIGIFLTSVLTVIVTGWIAHMTWKAAMLGWNLA